MSELLRIENLRFAYRQDVLRGVDFAVGEGCYVALVGRNGSGKTTLFNLIAGFLKPDSGCVRMDGRDIQKTPIPDRARAIALVPQLKSMDFPFTCLEVVLMGLHPHRSRFDRVTDEQLAFAEGIMRGTDTWRFAHKSVMELSGGELQRVVLSRALAQSPRLLLLDEAMSELDISARFGMMKLLRDRVQQGMTVVGIHHDLHTAHRFADRVIALKEGRIAADGTPGEVFTSRTFREVFLVDADIRKDGFTILDNIDPTT